jgi:hypothetical protein
MGRNEGWAWEEEEEEGGWRKEREYKFARSNA